MPFTYDTFCGSFYLIIMSYENVKGLKEFLWDQDIKGVENLKRF